MSVLFSGRGLCKSFGGIFALRDVDFDQTAGETLGMIGPNGSGKTTFINIATGNFRVDSGTLRFEDRDLSRLRPHEIVASGLVRTYQAVRIFSGLTVRENLETAMLMRKDAPGLTARSDECRELVDWLGLDRRLDAVAGGMTLFEQRRLELCTRMIMRPKLIMLDEPVGGLSPQEVRDMMKVLQELKTRCTIFVIEHTMHVIRELADRVVVLIAGQKIADGPPADILKDRRVIEQYLGTADVA